MRHRAAVGYLVGGLIVLALETVAVARWQGWWPSRMDREVRQQSMQVLPGADKMPAVPAMTAELPAEPPRPEDRHYAQLRSQIRWVTTRLGQSEMLTPDLPSRMLLARSAAERAGLREVGLGPEDVYGIINAESSWVPRTGASKDGTPNLGIAQFEPATAQAVGLRDPHDVVEAVHKAAEHMKEAAQWSAQRISGLKLSPQQRAAKLREGVSIYYNLSSRGRAAWNGRNTHQLPRETYRHIENARLGAREAAFLQAELGLRERDPEAAESVMTAAADAKPAYAR
ncbi:MAG TPA: hypothetical protein VEA35_10740 [Ramlibacter sp.]|nr:hypothetical protein [Ramlibacter sp.]